MRRDSILVPALWLCFSGLTIARAEIRSPFEIPPNGQPGALVGDVDFEAPSALAFDSLNRPYMFHSREPESFGSILTLREGKWVRLSYVEALRKNYPELQRPAKRFLHAQGTIAIDNDDALYAVVLIHNNKKETKWVLLYSPDLGGQFDVCELPGPSFLEITTGHNNMDQPPVVGSLVLRKKHPAEWTNYHNLLLFLPAKENRRLILGNPLLVSTNCFGVSNHSGGYSFAVTTKTKTHVVYADIPEDGKGNPTYAATIDRAVRRVIAKQFLVMAPPSLPDVHATPVISADRAGHLHVLAGAHGQSFYSMRSTEPDTIEDGWTQPQFQGRGQTYASLVCDSEDRLHSVYRVHPQLLYQHKPAGADAWSKPAVLVNAPSGHKGYTIFYHRMFMDRADALYLSFTFFEFHTGEKGRYPRALAISEDHGQTWRLATTATLQARVTAGYEAEPRPADDRLAVPSDPPGPGVAAP